MLTETLDIALLHLEVLPGKLETNRQTLFLLADQAAREGARIVLAPELSVSGYLSDCRTKVAPYVETLDGPTIIGLAEIARQYQIHICAGFAERGPCNSWRPMAGATGR